MNYRVLLLFAAYMVLILSLGYFRPEGRQAKYLIRKSVHLVTGLVIFCLSFHISRQYLLWLLIAGTFFSFFTYFIARFNYIHVTSKSSWGTLFYPLGILLSFLVLYEMPIDYFRISLLFLAISDTVANLGRYLVRGNPKFAILSEQKTPLGIAGFAITAFLILLSLLPESGSGMISYMILTVVCAVHFEIISFKGSDNLAVPFGTALFFFVTYGRELNALWITAVILFMAGASFLLFRTGVLTRKGSMAAYLLGVFLFGILGYEWAVPAVFFFVTSVIFTSIHGRAKRKTNAAGRRNIWQVTANILAAMAFAILYLATSRQIFIYLYMTTVAAVTADTWASEIGPLFHRRCFSLAGWRTATSGVSGGISLAGTLAAFAGAFLAAMLVRAGLVPGTAWRTILILAIAGFLASFVDSLMGAFVEPRLNQMNYFRQREGTESISPNDVVNLLASFSAPLFYLVMRSVVG